MFGRIIVARCCLFKKNHYEIPSFLSSPFLPPCPVVFESMSPYHVCLVKLQGFRTPNRVNAKNAESLEMKNYCFSPRTLR